eukprot:1588213-Prymnesium_polylepis.2
MSARRTCRRCRALAPWPARAAAATPPPPPPEGVKGDGVRGWGAVSGGEGFGWGLAHGGLPPAGETYGACVRVKG